MKFSFSIGDKEYSIPEVISVKTFVNAVAWDITDIKHHKPFVASISTCSIAELNKLEEETFNLILGVCISRIDFTETGLQSKINDWSLVNFEDFTFGDFMDVDLLLVGGGIKQNAIELVSKIYQMPEEVAAGTDIKLVWHALLALTKWRQTVYTEYEEFFGLNELKEDVQEENLKLDYEALQFMWYETVIILAGDNFLNISKVVERPYKEALNFLNYKKYQVNKQKLENLKKKNDVSRSFK